MDKETFYHWIQTPLKKLSVRLSIVGAATLVFAVVFPAVYREAGPPAGALVTVLVLISSILLGLRGGIAIWALSVPMFIVLVSPEATMENWPGIVATLILTIVVGVVKNYISAMWHHHQSHVTVNENRLTKINSCLLTFDADPLTKIKRLTALAGELLGSDYVLYNRYTGGKYVTVGFKGKEELVIGPDDPRSRNVDPIEDKQLDDVVVIRDLYERVFRDTLPFVPADVLHVYAGKSVRVDHEYAGTLCVMFAHVGELGRAEKEILGILASAIAVEEKRMRFETASRESELSYIDLFNTVTEAIYILDTTLTFVNVNEGALKMYDYTRQELIGKTPAFVAADGRNDMDHIAALIMNVYATGDPVTFDFWGKRKNGNIFPKQVSCSKGKYFGQDVIIATARDLTDQKKTQDQLMQSQKLESLGTLTGGIAHDFNNLLAMVLGSAELLQHQVADQPALKKHIDRIIEATERGTSISRQLLVFSRPDQVVLKPVAVSQIVAELQEMLKHFLPKSIVISTAIDDDTHMILGDAGQVHQALLNLALNARDAMENSGTLTIAQFAAPSETMKKRFPLAAAVPYIGICVSDTGVGMDPAVMARMFDPFFSTKEPGKGTGLGLAMVHGIMKNHDGYIDVQSTPGAGTSFTLYFPEMLHKHEPAIDENSPAAQKTSETILLVDDEEHIREMLTEFLSEEGYSIIAASNGSEALALFRQHQASIDLVITDLGMPEMGGEELYHHIRAIDPAVKVLVASGYLDGVSKDHLLSIGITDVLTKPSKLKDTQKAIRAALAGA